MKGNPCKQVPCTTLAQTPSEWVGFPETSFEKTFRNRIHVSSDTDLNQARDNKKKQIKQGGGTLMIVHDVGAHFGNFKIENKDLHYLHPHLKKTFLN